MNLLTRKQVLTRYKILGFPASKTVRNKFLLFISHPIYNIFIAAAAKTEAKSIWDPIPLLILGSQMSLPIKKDNFLNSYSVPSITGLQRTYKTWFLLPQCLHSSQKIKMHKHERTRERAK